MPLFVRIFHCSEMLSICADTLCEFEIALWICQMTNYSFKRINAERHILYKYICSCKVCTTGIDYTKNGIAGEKAWHNKTWVGSYYHRVVVSPLPYLGYIIYRRCSQKIIYRIKNNVSDVWWKCDRRCRRG